MSTVLVVAPHPDDETLGCGGTLLRHKKEGDVIHWLIMTRITEELGFDAARVNFRDKEINTVAKNFGFASVHKSKFNTCELDIIPKKELVAKVSQCISGVLPEIIYLPFRNDAHSDHKACFDAVASCTKSFRYPSIRKVRAYETLSETEFGIQPNCSGFQPNLWVDISKYIDQKIDVMRIYEGEMDNFPFPRSERNIRALASLRGATAGYESAEAFMSLKELL